MTMSLALSPLKAFEWTNSPHRCMSFEYIPPTFVNYHSDIIVTVAYDPPHIVMARDLLNSLPAKNVFGEFLK